MAEKIEVDTGFPVSLAEFLNGVKGKVEMKAGFEHLCRQEKITGNKLPGDWQKLFELFGTKPVSVPWSVWAQKGGRK